MYYLFIYLFISILLTYSFLYVYINYFFYTINKNNQEKSINKIILPIVKNNKHYIEYQTKIWINKRKKKELCYALFEKDKIIMINWIKKYNIKIPNILYYDYYNNFTKKKLEEILKKNKNKNLIIKISHLQSNYGIILINSKSDINEIYNKCKKLFSSCFVCNHDNNNAPTLKEIKERKKESHYLLYETIQPGIIIQDYFNSYNNEKIIEPIEIKILLISDKIIKISSKSNIKYSFYYNNRFKLLFNEAKLISQLLGSYLIRIDFFIKETDNPYIPYLNEISLSPNHGFNKNIFISNYLLNFYKNQIKNFKTENYEDINKLLLNSPYRTLPIDKYLTDKSCSNEKFKF